MFACTIGEVPSKEIATPTIKIPLISLHNIEEPHVLICI
jgi:hypothetical protein